MNITIIIHENIVMYRKSINFSLKVPWIKFHLFCTYTLTNLIFLSDKMEMKLHALQRTCKDYTQWVMATI